MEKLSELLQKTLAAFGATTAALGIARHRYAKQHGRQEKAHEKKLKARETADDLRKAHKPKKAERKDTRAARLSAREKKAHNIARVALGEVKRLNQQKKGLEQTADELRSRIKRISGPKVEGNKVTGGTDDQKLQLALLTAAQKCATGKRRNFYSQAGTYDVEHAITGEPYGHRSDCSQFGAAIYHSCGLHDPNDQGFRGGFTGTLESHGRSVTRNFARHNAGCAVLFGPHGATHHVEWSLGDGTEHTVGHGSSPVDVGTFDLLSGTVQFRAYD